MSGHYSDRDVDREKRNLKNASSLRRTGEPVKQFIVNTNDESDAANGGIADRAGRIDARSRGSRLVPLFGRPQGTRADSMQHTATRLLLFNPVVENSLPTHDAHRAAPMTMPQMAYFPSSFLSCSAVTVS